MPILNSLISLINSKRIKQIETFKREPGATQDAQLKHLIDTAAKTHIGELYDFKTIKSADTFRERVPVVDYEGVKPFVERLKRGEKDLLWPGEIKWFAKSSGTTSSKSKFIPVSKDSLEECHFRGGKDVIALYLENNPESELFPGKCLVLGGSHQINSFSSDSYYGDLSAILIENMPFWTQFLKTPDPSIALMAEWEAKLEKMTEATIDENVTSLAGVPSWFLVLLKNILKKTGKSNLLEVWPNLELFIHGGINFTPYREQYKALIPSDKMNYQETYNASEGFFAIQDDLSAEGMLLMLDYGIFYEFMPLSELGKEHPVTYTIDEVEKDKDYAIVISTNGGLWRYLIGDTVRFVSLKPHRIIITGRTKHFINAFGEELIVDNAERGLAAACKKTGAVIREYTAAPVFMSQNSKGRHQWLIEFEKMPDDLKTFEKTLDETLKSLNSDYEAKRYKDMTLEHLEVIVARDGLFMEWMASRNKLGGQNKVPRLANDRKYIDELIALNNR